MKNGIRSVQPVSDGIIIGFVDGTQCYYSASFLASQIGVGTNQVFLDHDPFAPQPWIEIERHSVPALLPS